MENSTENSTEKRLKNLKPPFPKGKSGNPKGREKGQKNFATLYREALVKLGKLNGKTPEELELELVSAGFTNARKGDYRFYKDTLDRVHGQAKQEHKFEGDINVTITKYD